MRYKNKLSTILILMCICLVGFGIYYYFQLFSNKSRKTSEETRYVPINEASPIKKGYLLGNGGVSYEIDGVLSSELERVNPGLIKGSFVLSDDPLGRNIDIFLSVVGGDAYLGTYEGGLEGESKWNTVSSEALVQIVKPGRQVRLKIMLRKVNQGGEVVFASRIEDVLDTLALEYTLDNFSYSIPENFGLSVESLGIIK